MAARFNLKDRVEITQGVYKGKRGTVASKGAVVFVRLDELRRTVQIAARSLKKVTA